MNIKYLIPVGLCVVVFLFAGFTNPTNKADYVDWVNEQVKEEEGFLVGLISKPFINSMTSKSNYGILTVYETAFDEDNKIVALGMFDKFIWMGGKSSE